MSANTSYTIKMLEARITLAKGGFNPGTGQAANTKIIRLGMDVEISKPGGKEKNKAKVRIYNLPLEDMETLTTLAFAPLKTDQNHIAVYAGDKQNGMTLAFSGDIVSAVPNFNAAPDPTFDCDCITGFVASLTPVPPLTAQGAQDVGNTLQSIAGQMGLTFVNRGVNVSLRNTCWVGGPMEQARQIADAARIALLVDDGEMIIAQAGMVSACRAVRDSSGKVTGVAAIDITLGTLTDLIKNVHIGRTGFVILVQDDGVVISDPKNPQHNFQKIDGIGNDALAALFKSGAATGEAVFSGKQYEAVVYNSPELKWKFIGFIEKSELMEPVNAAVWQFAAGMLASLIGICIGIWVLAGRLIITPLKTVGVFLKDISAGVYGSLANRRVDEIGVIFESLNSMSTLDCSML